MSVLTELASGRQAYRGVERRQRRRYGLDAAADEDFTSALRARIRELPPESAADTKSWLQWAFDIIDAPRNVTANLINTVAGSPVRGGTRKGLFGLPEVSGGELLKKAGVDFGDSTAGSVGNFLADFGANVVLDPLSWVTFGAGGALGTAAKKVGGKALSAAGETALRQGVERTVGRRAARGLAELARRGAGDEARAAFRTAQETRLLERLGNRRIAQNLGEAATKLGDTAAPALGPATKPMAREFARQRGAKELEELLAKRITRDPAMLERNGIGLGTNQLRQFHPLDLPLAIPAGLAGVVAPKFTQRFVAPVVEGLKEVTRPVLAPWQYLPKAHVTLASSEAVGKLARSLGLPQAAEATGLAAVGRGVRAGAAEVGRELGKRFIGEPRPPRPNDAADLRRWELEKWEQFNAQATARAQRAMAFDEARFVAEQRGALERRLGLDPHTAGRIDAYLTEARGASDAPSKLYETVGNMLEEGGYDRALASKIVEGADDVAFQKGTGNREPGTGVAPTPPAPLEDVAQQTADLPTGTPAAQDVPAKTVQALVRHVESFNTIPAIRSELRIIESALATPGIPLGRRASYEFIRTGLNARLGHLERAAIDAPTDVRRAVAERHAPGPVDVQPKNPTVDNPGAMGFARAKLKAVRDGVSKDPERTIKEARTFLLKNGYSKSQAEEFIANALRKPDLAPAGEWQQGRPPVSQLNLFGERIEVAPRQGTLFAPDDLRPRTAETPKHVAAPAVDPATVKPGLLEMVRGVLKEIPGNKIPTPTQVRNALIAKYGSGAVQDQMVAKLRGTLWEPELRAAIDTAERGAWMFGQKGTGNREPGTGLDLAPRVTVGDRVTVFDSERRPYEAELRLIDLADEAQRPLASHRAVGRKEITGLVAEERFPAGFQARERTSAASVAQVEGIRRKPVFELLLDVGPDATAGPPVLWRDPTAGLVVVQGNGRMIGMDRWDAATWEKYKAALAERVGPDAVAGMKKPALVRVMSGGAQEARQLGAYGQEAIGLKQTMFEQARALLNSLSPEELGNIPAPRLREPVTRDNVVQLLDDGNNRRFREWLLRGLDDDQRRSLLASPDALAERVNTAFIAMLPAEVGRIAARGGAKMEQAFAAIAPMAARLSSLVREGTVRPQYDLYAALEGAARILERGRKFKGGYAAFVRELDALEQTGRLTGFAAGGDEVSLPGLAIATLLRQAENATDPAATVVTKLQNVLQTALADDPRQMAMFAVTPEETAALAYLTAAVGPNRAEQILQAAPTLRGRAGQAAADIPATTPPAAATELAAPPPAAAATPPEKPPLTVEPGTPRARVYADLDRTAQTLGWAPQKTKLMYRVLGHFSDDAFRSLGVEAGTAADVADIRQRTQKTPAAAYWSGLSEADRAAVQADGLIQLFKHSEDYDDVGLLLEELNHHVYYNVLADAERAQITRWYQSRQAPEWAEWLRKRGVRSELADYYAGSERELYARVFVDYAMGKEIDADPEVATLFEKVLRRIRDLYRDLTGSGEIGVDPRIEATFERFYSAPKPQQMEGVAPPAGGPGQLFGTREPVRVAQTPGPRPSVPEEPVRAGAPDELFDRGDPTSIGGPVLPQPGLTLAKDVQPLVDHLQARAWLRLQEAKASGAPVVRLVTERNVQYLRRVLAPDLRKPGAWATLKRVVTGQMLGDARTSLGEWFRRTSMSLFAPNQKGRLRNVREQMTHEINALVRRVNETLEGAAPADAQVQRIIAELDLRPGQKLGAFSEDPLLNHVLREIEHVKTIGSAEFINEIVRRHGVKIERNVPLPAGYVRVHAGQFGELTRDYALPIDAAALVEKHVKQWERPDRLLAGYNWILNKWKGLALIAPAYHMRNLWGNVWNASLGDGFDAKAWAEAAELLRAAAHGDAGAGRIAGTSLTRQELYRKLLVDEGLIGSGFYGVEFRTSAESVQKTIDAVLQPPGWGKFWKQATGGNLLRANQTAGQIIEDASKVGFVIARMRRGDTLPQAAAAAKKYLFDYGDLTDFERGLRYVMPFYTWTRKNAELMLLTAAVQPWRLALIPKIQMTAERALAGDERLPLGLRPEHVRKELGVQVGPLNAQGSAPFVNLGYLAPVQEARLFTPGAGEHLLEAAGGPWKAPVELAMNRDWYFDRPIQEYEGQRKEMLGVPMPPGLKHVARMVRPLNVAEQTARNIGLAGTPGEVAQTALQAATGLRTFNVDAARQVLQREYELNQQVGALKRDIRRRLRELPPGADAAQDPETRRLLGLYAQQMEQRDALPGSMVRRQMAPGRRAAREQFAELTAGG